MNESKTINLESLHRFQINHLTVEYGLMGVTHEFSFLRHDHHRFLAGSGEGFR
jgi:hypothetical protein